VNAAAAGIVLNISRQGHTAVETEETPTASDVSEVVEAAE
jgi:hypothetical protein